MVTVLYDTRRRHWGQNPYMRMLADHVVPGAVPLGFSWRTALCESYDVFHVHWPEYLLKMPTARRRYVARILFCFLLLRLTISRIVVVRTRHNKSAHVDLGRVDSLLLLLLQRRVVSEIRMNYLAVGDLVPGRVPHIVHIPHGNYHPHLDSLNVDIDSIPPRGDGVELLSFGILRPYKNFDEVVRAVASAPSRTRVRLCVAGSSADGEYTAMLKRLAENGGGSVELDIGRVDDDKLVQLIRRCDYVVVPYAELYNSGVVLLALSLDTPVVLRDSEASREMLEEFGEEWVRIYKGPFTSDVVARVTGGHSTSSSTSKRIIWRPDRDWSYVGRETVKEYIHALRGPRCR